MADLVDPAINTIASILADPEVNVTAKLRAAETALDRAGFGRAPSFSNEDAKEMLLQRLLQMRAQQNKNAELSP